ncbi:hypothetical protein F7984_17615 [Pradoshia sp. D12]|uniref:hypothetical protein n=1 Tax=Bacillaceae TaxID=186817 RepID=UPI00112B1451|nr:MULTISPECIES: hypothetical protein [Bacillaceae]QFK72914.1 hypothetical protein F7984_17615 [Pradoshia sp. D12]TPF71906.1 hypothetical protein FHY44_10310 [Bacillus sp. D12]
MKRIWITGVTALLCIGFLVYGNNHYHAEIQETRAKAYKQYTEDQANQSLEEAQLEKERKSINGQQQKKLVEAQKVIKKVYDDSKYQSTELKGVLQDLSPLIKQKGD